MQVICEKPLLISNILAMKTNTDAKKSDIFVSNEIAMGKLEYRCLNPINCHIRNDNNIAIHKNSTPVKSK